MPPRVVRQHRAGTAAVMSRRWAPVIDIGRRAALDPKLGRAVNSGEKVVVIGSFRRVANARRTARTLGALSPTIVPARVKGRTYFRVVSRPLVAGELGSVTRTLKRGGITGAENGGDKLVHGSGGISQLRAE